MTNFSLGAASRAKLNTVDPLLQSVVEQALAISDVDFSVVDGLRTKEQQAENIKNGVSWSMDSKHLDQGNGFAEAVDIYPWVNSKTSHEPQHYRKVARAMFQAAIDLEIQVEWGGLWVFNDPEKIDAPHWELR